MKNKNFIIIVLGQIISLFGNAIQRFSMSLYLLEFTGSTAAFANILAISTIPYILFAPIAGKLADNINKKKIMVYLDFFCSLLIGVYAIILFSNKDNTYIVAIMMFLLSICYTLYGPAVSTSIPQIVEEDKLISANGIINQVGSIVNFIGPILAGILYGLLGIKVIVLINAISFFISAIMELFLDIPDVDKSNKEENKKLISINFIVNSFKDMKDSFIYLKKSKKVILGIIASYGLCNIFLVPILSIIAPYFINIVLELPSEIYGLVESICVLGMIVGAFFISIRPKFFSIQKVHYTYFPMLLGIFFMCFLGFIKGNNYVLASIFAISGMIIMLSLSLSNVLTLTYIQKEIPTNMLGRVSAFSTAIATISVAPGQLLYGQVIDIGMPLKYIFILTLIINIGLVIFIKWNVREIK